MNRARRLFVNGVFGGAMAFAMTSLTDVADAAPTVPQQASLEVMVLHATQNPGGGSIGPGIGNMPQLEQPPFSAWNTYRLLAKQSLSLQKGTPLSYGLPNGRTLQITLDDILPGPRYRISAAINQPGGTSYLKLLGVTAPPNQTFFVAGQQFQGGVMIIGFTLH